MKLVNDIEAMINILGKEKGNFIITANGSATPKQIYDHFLILHSFAPEAWEKEMTLQGGYECLSVKKKTSKKGKLSVEEELKEISDNIVSNEIEEEEILASGESQIMAQDDSKVRVIARKRQITVHSEMQLTDNGWFLCPIYEGVDGLYPMMFKILPKSKGYQMFVSKVPLVSFPADTFTLENKKKWHNNAMFMVDNILQSNGVFNLRCYSVFVHKKEDNITSMIKKLISQYDICQKTRIKQGNILIDEVLTTVGQNAYVSNKENLSKKKKGDFDEEVNEYDTNNIKIIDEIMAAYNKINMVAEKENKTISRESTFRNIRYKIIQEENEEERILIKNYIKDHADTLPEDLSKDELYEFVKGKIHTLSCSDYINNYTIYMSCMIYDNFVKNEARAEKAMSKVVAEHPIWVNVISQEKGLGPVSAARLIANIDIEGTNHPSSIIKYVGLDQVIVRPDHSKNVAMSKKELHDIVCMLHKDWQIINRNTTLDGMPELNEDTYDIKYKSDCLPVYNAYKTVDKVFKDMESGKVTNIEDILNYPNMNAIVDYIWKNMVVVERITVDGPDYVIQKRARNKADTSISTYLTKDGKVELKGGLGYNASMKSTVLAIIVGSFLKTKNPTYSKIYNDSKERQRQQCIENGINPEDKGMKNRIHKRAIRVTGQRFLENYWIACRQFLGLPLNGGTYYEGKIQGRHLHGINPAVFDNN